MFKTILLTRPHKFLIPTKGYASRPPRRLLGLGRVDDRGDRATRWTGLMTGATGRPDGQG
eukprot:4084673-Pyramimonas_sp.AAC.1